MGIERRNRKGGEPSYRAEWFDHEGKRHTETFRTLTDAKGKLRQELAHARQISAGLKAPPSDHRTFAQLAAYWLEHRAPEKRSAADDEASIRVHLLPVLGPIDLRKLGRADLDAVRANLEAARIVGAGPRRNQPDPGGRPYAPRTIQKILTLLGSLLRLAEDLGWIDRAPRIRKPKVPKRESARSWLRTEAEISRFLGAAQAFDDADEAARARGEAIRGPREERIHPWGVFPLYATAVYLGLRLGELAALRWSVVDLEKGRILVARSHDADTTKGRYVRTVPIVDALLPILKAWRLRSRGIHVFPSTAGTQRGQTDRVWREVFHQVRASAGLPRQDDEGLPLTFHSLRHTWASHLAMRGVELYTLQKLGGWKSFEMVQVYAHLLPETFDKVRGMMPAPELAARGKVVPIERRAAKRAGKG